MVETVRDSFLPDMPIKDGDDVSGIVGGVRIVIVYFLYSASEWIWMFQEVISACPDRYSYLPQDEHVG